MSCSIHGSYKNRFNNGYGSSWVKINSDNTFEYITWGHMTGYGYSKGSWNKINDSIFLTPFEPKLPKTNELIEINNNTRNINLVDNKGKTLFPSYLKINGEIDSITSDFNGNYSISKFNEVNRIEVFDLGNTEGKIGQIIANFKTECANCSYRIIIDWDKIGFKRAYGLNTTWIYNKKNRLYPIDSLGMIRLNDKPMYYKKIDSVKPINFSINSWNSMKNGFE